MQFRLIPQPGQHYLSPRAVVACLIAEFGYVASSDEDGRRYVQAMIRELHAIREQGSLPVDDEYVERLRRAEHEAIYVYFGDSASDTSPLGAAVIPGEPLFFTIPPGKEPAGIKSLLSRCAVSLRYDVLEE